jgi:actin-related protein 5
LQDDGLSDSEEDQEKLAEYESFLKEHDPKFLSPEEQEISSDSVEWYQLHLATERIKVPEILFQVNLRLKFYKISSDCKLIDLFFNL